MLTSVTPPPPTQAQLSSHTCPAPSEEFRMSHAGCLWGLLLMQTSSSSRQAVVWMPQCSRHLLARPFAPKLVAELGLWPWCPGLPPFLHLGPGAGGETEHIPFVASNVGAAQSLSECQRAASEGYPGGRGYHSLLRCIPVLAGDWHQYVKCVKWMLIYKIRIPRDSWGGTGFDRKSFTGSLSSFASRVCIQKRKMWWIRARWCCFELSPSPLMCHCH